MTTSTAPVLVTGSTGRQGGATARALLASGVPVRALVRDPTSEAAQRVEALGAQLVTGDLHDRDAVTRAAQGVRAVFSVQMPPMTEQPFEAELEQATNLVEGALAAGVPQFVHSSVSGAGQHVDAPGWDEGRWAAMEPYYTTKAEIQDRVREAGFASWTVLKPGFFMENFLPELRYLFPRGLEGGLITPLHPETRLSLVAVDDIGTAAAAAIAEPQRFDGVSLELASERLSMTEIAATLSEATGVAVDAPDLTLEQAAAAGMSPMSASHEWMNVVDQPARPELALALDLPLTTFAQWARTHMPTA